MALDSVRVYYGLGPRDGDTALRLTAQEMQSLQEQFAMSMKQGSSADTFTALVTRMLNARAGVAWSSSDHTARPVEVFAIGKGAEAFRGSYENSDIAKKIIRIAALSKALP